MQIRIIIKGYFNINGTHEKTGHLQTALPTLVLLYVNVQSTYIARRAHTI